MLSRVSSLVLDGLTARAVTIEVDVHRGLPSFAIVGLPDTEAREARERIRAALVNSGYEFPLQRVVVNVAPAAFRKAAPSLDLAIATALLIASDQLDPSVTEETAFVGGLDLSGRIRAVEGTLVIADAAREAGILRLVTASASGAEAALAGTIEVKTLEDLAGLRAAAWGCPDLTPIPLALPVGRTGGADLADLRGIPHARYALEVAAAGGHGLLLVGPRGSGKASVAARMPSILPPMGRAEALDVVRIASAAGWPDLPAGRPFRAPYHTISAAGLLGGGRPWRLGEATRAHHGVLFLDGLGEFRRMVLEALRPALEDGELTVQMEGVRRRVPASFQLIAASEACPCGAVAGDCACLPLHRARFRARMTDALGEHLPITVDMTPPTLEELADPPGQSSAVVRDRVESARRRSEARLGAGRTNAQMTIEEVRGLRLTSGAARLLAASQARRPMPRPSTDQTIRLARTVADLAGTEILGEESIEVALGLRGEAGPDAAA
jgi:magnesium chelatase family protein